MISLAQVIAEFEPQLRAQYGARLLPSHRRALGDMKRCRTVASRQMQVQCNECEHSKLIPHSCGNRLCPHCQNHESQRWLERQQQKRVPCEYFLVTFTVPRELRALSFAHQRLFYDALMNTAWSTIKSFTRNDKELNGTAGAVAVLHTHTRRLDYHPHVHLVVPGAAINGKEKRWRCRVKKGYLFNEKALASVFRARLLESLASEQLDVPKSTPRKWVIDCKSVGSGAKALSYLGRYLYRGVVREKDILSISAEEVTYRYTENTNRTRVRTISGSTFLWNVLKHTLPKGFRRARNYGFLHHNSKRLIVLIQLILMRHGILGPEKKSKRAVIRCEQCGGEMRIVAVGVEEKHWQSYTEPGQMGRLTAM